MLGGHRHAWRALARCRSGRIPCHDPALALRCPDLVMAPPSHLRVDAQPSRKRVVLRMENRIVNLGAGPAELFGERVSLSEMRARPGGVRRRGAAATGS